MHSTTRLNAILNGKPALKNEASTAVPAEMTQEKAAFTRPGETLMYVIEMKVAVGGGFLPPDKRHLGAYLRGRLGVPEQDEPGQPYRLVGLEVRQDISALR